MNTLAQRYYRARSEVFSRLQCFDGLGPLALRLFLVPVFWMAGTHKLAGMEQTIEWFGNPDWGLGLPFPTLLAYLAAYTEAARRLHERLDRRNLMVKIPGTEAGLPAIRA